MLATRKIAVVIALASQLIGHTTALAQDSHKASSVRHAAATKVVSKSHLPIWSKNVKVPYRSWIPLESPKEVLLCVHGLGFSSESFTEFGRLMAGRGLAVYALDVEDLEPGCRNATIN